MTDTEKRMTKAAFYAEVGGPLVVDLNTAIEIAEETIPPIDEQHDVAKEIARQHGFDPKDLSFARCVGAVMQAWRLGS